MMAVGHYLIFARTPSGEYLRPFSDYWFALVWLLPKIAHWGGDLRVLAVLGLVWAGLALMDLPQIRPRSFIGSRPI